MARDLTDLKAALVGAGFIGVVHAEALRRLGIEVVGVCEAPGTPLAPPLPAAYGSYEEMLADDRVDVVHLATPNHLHHAQARAALEAGKHVVCEKPLAMTAAEGEDLVALARERGLVAAVNFMSRFYPQAREARARRARGELGEVVSVHGSYLQDWLLYPTDWNWRLEPELGGELRAVADIGSHWLDLVGFVTGLEVVEVFAELQTVHPTRLKPAGPVLTYAAAEGEGVETPIATEDCAHLLLRFANGARGSATISQVTAGRKNQSRFEISCRKAAVAWNSERPEELWIGYRDRPNELLLRDPSLLDADSRSRLPGGHAEGFQETFRELCRAVYTAVAAGGPPPEPDYPTFEDGLCALRLGEAVLRSAREGSWIAV